jgi:hypothetical protein
VTTADTGPIDVAEFDVAPSADAAAELVPCCASRRWVASLVKTRPHASLPRLSVASDSVLATLSWPELAEALLHDSAAINADELGELRDRLRDDPFVEQDFVRSELARIVRLRLAAAFH